MKVEEVRRASFEASNLELRFHEAVSSRDQVVVTWGIGCLWYTSTAQLPYMICKGPSNRGHMALKGGTLRE